MNILCLGGTGNLSTACAELFLVQGHAVTLQTRGVSPIPAGFQHLKADRHNPGELEKAIGDKVFDVVCDFITYNASDAEQMIRLFSGRCKQYIFVSTVCVYVRPAISLPYTENSQQGNVYSPYGQDKQRAEEVFMNAYRNSGFPVTIVRPSHTYSERWIPNPVTSAGYTLAWRLEHNLPVFLHDDGQNLWTLTEVHDFATGFCGLAGLTSAIGEAFQITSDMVLTWNQIMAEICRALNISNPVIKYIPSRDICAIEPMMTAKLLGDKANHGVFDCAKIKRFVPDFQCRTTFREGIQRSIQWFKADASRQVPDPKINAIFENILTLA